ncbi:MAG: DUF4236 domain-containing protein [Rhodospirillales bacterium]|nr:MAG: DUF4236 domain-containing protein [Rhodospirillales bacterium]
MGFSFRKRIGLGKLVRVNLSRSGVSVGLGPPGLNVNIGPRGVRKTIGIPGSGLSYQTFKSWGSPTGAVPPPVVPVAPPPAAPASAVGSSRFQLGLLALLAFLAAAWFLPRWFPESGIPPRSFSTAPPPPVPAPDPPAAAATAPAPPPPLLPRAATPAPTASAPSVAPSPPVPAASPITATDIQEVQTRLKALGHDPGPVDGSVGPRTQSAIRAYQSANALPVTGEVTRALIDRLKIEGRSGAR